MNNDLDLMRATINTLSMRVMLLDIGLNEMARAVPREKATAIAEGFRRRAASAMQDRAGHLTEADDKAMTLCIASILESLGQPPSRG